jgi:hypothetical protein
VLSGLIQRHGVNLTDFEKQLESYSPGATQPAALFEYVDERLEAAIASNAATSGSSPKSRRTSPTASLGVVALGGDPVALIHEFFGGRQPLVDPHASSASRH